MDNTVYQYRDKNGNAYHFYISPAGNCILEYSSCQAAKISTHKAVISVITMADYNYLVYLLRVAISDRSPAKEFPETDYGEILIITGKEKKYPLDRKSDAGRTIEGLIAVYKKKYS